jgi:transcriptional regulator with XRE-family HTH domain
MRTPGKLLRVTPKPRFKCDIRASFAVAFSMWRRKRNIPLKKIARDLGLSVATVNSWELGKRFPTAYNFEMLSNYTGVPPCRLFCVMADKCVPTECLLATGLKA